MNQRIDNQSDREGGEDITRLAQVSQIEESSGEVAQHLNDTAEKLNAALDPEAEKKNWRAKLQSFTYIKDPAEQRRFVLQNYEWIIKSFEAAFSKRGIDYVHTIVLERLMERDHFWLGKDIMSSLLKKISEEVKESGSIYFFDGIIKLAVRNGNRDAFDIIEMYLANRINEEDEKNRKSEMRGFLADVFTSKQTPPHIAERAENIIRDYLTSLGITAGPCIKIWTENYKSSSNENIGASIAAHLYSITHLEEKCPGAARYLNSECGIYFFRRYNTNLLKELFEERYDNEKPYGVLFFPHDDHNGAFVNDSNSLYQLKKELGTYGYTVRLTETGDLGRFEAAAAQFHRRGGKREIAFAIVAGHGTRDTIQLGQNYTYDSTKFSAAMQRIRPLFAENAQMIFVSCSTGQAGGVASKVASMKGGFNTIGPNMPTNVRKIAVSVQEGKLTLDPEYRDPESKRSYAASR